MLTAIEIENFKGFGKRQRMELGPLTLIFGANSAGKSSFFQSLFFLQDFFARGFPNFGRLNYFSESIDLGGFENVLHNHDLNNVMRFRLEFDVKNSKVSDERGTYILPVVLQVVHLGLELEILADVMGAPVVSCVSIYFGEGEVLRLFRRAGEMAGEQEICLTVYPEFIGVVSDHVDFSDCGIDDFEELTEFTIKRPAPKEPETITSVLRTWPMVDLDEEQFEFVKHCVWSFDGVLNFVNECLSDFLYVGPLRDIPTSSYRTSRKIAASRWSTGLAAWDYLALSEKENPGSLQTTANNWLSRMKVGVSVDVKSDELLPGDLGIPLKVSAKVISTATSNGRNPSLRVQDVGCGVSQLVPLIVALLLDRRKTVIVEQPELHLHPRLQTELGDLFLYGRSKHTNAIVETHSEHLILRILRRIRETYEGELPSGYLEAKTSDVSVQYFQSTNIGTKVTRLRINEEGEFVDSWPYGFFDERIGEMYG